MKQLSTEKMVEHMLKFFLIFNLSFMFIDPVLGQIRNDQEIFEFLLASGLLTHCWNSFKKFL